jgi:hypothetical protein
LNLKVINVFIAVLIKLIKNEFFRINNLLAIKHYFFFGDLFKEQKIYEVKLICKNYF